MVGRMGRADRPGAALLMVARSQTQSVVKLLFAHSYSSNRTERTAGRTCAGSRVIAVFAQRGAATSSSRSSSSFKSNRVSRVRVLRRTDWVLGPSGFGQTRPESPSLRPGFPFWARARRAAENCSHHTHPNIKREFTTRVCGRIAGVGKHPAVLFRQELQGRRRGRSTMVLQLQIQRPEGPKP